ncbi:F-box/kelch-repeat protein At5g42350-like [Rutidosis leptorrhynchoides]|uniref:F-box/kelch-repeat protein At5g42350-like n=1 Tax=Rutidosis leptorrhynchoides TaxID=125765 RepID=UPI003A9959F7
MRFGNNHHDKLMEEDDETRGVLLKCLSLYSRGGGCKVCATTSDEFGEIAGKVYKPVCGAQDTSVGCFSYGVENFKKRHNKKKNLQLQEPLDNNNQMHVFLPDDILEMCLMRLPLTSLMNSRLVCKRWRALTTTARFMQMRRDGSYPSPWLFLFGTAKDSFFSGDIHAFDVSFNKWHKIEAEILKGRFSFSVTSVYDNIFIVGGRSSLGKMDRHSSKTHKGVLVLSPSTKSWHKVASMKYARSKPVVGVYEVNTNRLTIKSQHNHFLRTRTRVGGVSDVYEDPHRLSVRRLSRTSFDNQKSTKSKVNNHVKDRQRFLIIAAGGFGSWDEALDSCEIFDSSSNKWTEIQRLPIDFGPACSAVVCNGIFYVYSESDKLAAYDISHGYWVRVQWTPPPPRIHEYSPRLMSCDDQRLFMVSVSWCEGDGEIGRRNKAVRKLWEFDFEYLTWNEVCVHPDAPMDWNSVFVADKNLIFGVEMFKIFGQVLEFLTMCDVSDPKMNWVHLSKNQVARQMDVSSCAMKSMAVVHL